MDEMTTSCRYAIRFRDHSDSMRLVYVAPGIDLTIARALEDAELHSLESATALANALNEVAKTTGEDRKPFQIVEVVS